MLLAAVGVLLIDLVSDPERLSVRHLQQAGAVAEQLASGAALLHVPFPIAAPLQQRLGELHGIE